VNTAKDKIYRVFTALRLNFGVRFRRAALGVNLKLTFRRLHEKEREEFYLKTL
jgi:hypothetical protein